MLNADRITDGRKFEVEYLRLFSDLREEKLPEPVTLAAVRERKDLANTFELSGQFSTASREAQIAILVSPDATAPKDISFTLLVTLDGREVEVHAEHQEGRSQWFTLNLIPGRHTCAMTVRRAHGSWSGPLRTQVWSVGRIAMPLKKMDVTVDPVAASRVLPPVVWQSAEVSRNVKLGEVTLEVHP